MARLPLWRGCADEAAAQTQRQRALIALGLGLALGAVGWVQGGWGNPADLWDILAPVALVSAVVLRARAVPLSPSLPRELATSAILAIPYASAGAIVVGPLGAWFLVSSSLGEELRLGAQAEAQAALWGAQPAVALTLSLILTLYGIAVAWVVYRRQRVLAEEGADEPFG